MSQFHSSVTSNERQVVNAQRGPIDPLAGIVAALSPEELQGVCGGAQIEIIEEKKLKKPLQCTQNPKTKVWTCNN